MDVSSLGSALLVAVLVACLAAAGGWWAGRAGLAASRAEVAGLRTALRYEHDAGQEKLAVLDESRERFEQAFSALSAEALARNNRQFLDLATATLAQSEVRASADLDARRDAVEHVVAPLRETLGKVEGQLRELETARVGAYTSVLEQVSAVRQSAEQVRAETASLVASLRRPQSRGAWGELSLRRAVELAGMNEHCDFTVQPTLTDAEEGVQRPDMVVRLAGGRSVVVDSKVPLDAFLDAMQESDELARGRLWKAHAVRLRAHVDQLAAKAYWQRCPGSPEFVVLFVPQEAFLAPALDADPALLDHAAARKVVLATPTTLIALLRTVAHAWTQQALADNAREVYETGRELYARLGTLGGHVDKLGRSLGVAVSSYNRAVGSLEGRVLVTARRFAAMGLVTDDLPMPEGVELGARTPVAPELVDPAVPGVGDVLPLRNRDGPPFAGDGASPERRMSQ
jgi:DNA recombination protein RmuC